MDNYKKLDNIFILSGIFAVFLYVLLLLIMMVIFKASKEHIAISISTPSKISTLSVNILEDTPTSKKSDNKTQSVKNNQAKAKDSNKDSGSSTPVAGLGVGDLFNKIDIKKPINKEIEQKDNRDVLALNKKATPSANEQLNQILEKTQNIMKTLDNLNQNIVISDSTSSKFCEKYSDYCKEITELLYKSWNAKSSFDEKLSSKVVIAISKDGNFSYTIRQKSGNDIFDKELAESLQNLGNTKFPTIKDVNINSLEVIFGNKGENK